MRIDKLKGIIPIGGWVGPLPNKELNEDFLYDKVFQEIKDSGVNIIYTVLIDSIKELNSIKKIIECAEKSGIFVVVGDNHLVNDDVEENKKIELINLCKNSSAVIGINIYDEPGMNAFPKIKATYYKYKEQFGDLMFYVNLFPMYASNAQIAGCFDGSLNGKETSVKRYEQYIEEFSKLGISNICSYDFYPFRNEKGVIHPKYFKNLSICSKFAIKYNLSLWNFIQLTSWNREYIRDTTYSEILWLISTSIAYNVVGLQYFCYWSPFDNRGETYGNAMINTYGKKTKTYFYVKELNKHIIKISPYILNSTYAGIILFGNSNAPVPEEDNIEKFGNIDFIEAEGLLIGCYIYNGKNMYYVVNTSLIESRHITLHFKNEIPLTIIKSDNQYDIIVKDFSNVLYEGEGILLVETN